MRDRSEEGHGGEAKANSEGSKLWNLPANQRELELGELRLLMLSDLTSSDLESNHFERIKAVAKKQWILDYYFTIVKYDQQTNLPILHWAAVCNQIETVKSYLNGTEEEDSSSADQIDCQSRTLSMIAVDFGHLELFETLLYHKNHNLLQSDIHGDTVLDYMVKKNRLDFIQSLLQYLEFHQTQQSDPKKSEEERLQSKEIVRQGVYAFMQGLASAAIEKDLEMFKVLFLQYQELLQKTALEAADTTEFNQIAYYAAYYDHIALLDYLLEEQLITVPPQFDRSNPIVFAQFIEQLKYQYLIQTVKTIEKNFEPAKQNLLTTTDWQNFANDLNELWQLVDQSLLDESLKLAILGHLERALGSLSEGFQDPNAAAYALDALWNAGYQLEMAVDILEGRRPCAINDYSLQKAPPLPEEVLFSILTYVDPASLIKMQQANRGLNRLANDDYIWKNLFETFFPEEKPNLALVDYSWKTAFKTHYLEQYGVTTPLIRKSITLILRADLDTLKTLNISRNDLLANDFLLLKTAARVRNQAILDHFYAIAVKEINLELEQLRQEPLVNEEQIKQKDDSVIYWQVLCDQLTTDSPTSRRNYRTICHLPFSGVSLFTLAAEIGHVELFKGLLKDNLFLNTSSTEYYWIALSVGKGGCIDIFRSFIEHNYYRSLDRSFAQKLISEILFSAVRGGRIGLINYMLESQEIDLMQVFFAIFWAGNLSLFEKLSSNRANDSAVATAYRISANEFITSLGASTHSRTLFDNPCIELLVQDPSVDVSLDIFISALREKKTAIVQKILGRPDSDIYLPYIVELFTSLIRDSVLTNSLLPYIDLEKVIYKMIDQGDTLLDIRNIIHLNDEVLKRPRINKSNLIDHASKLSQTQIQNNTTRNRSKIIKGLKAEIGLGKELEATETNYDRPRFTALEIQFKAAGQKRGWCYYTNQQKQGQEPQLPKRIQLTPDEINLEAYAGLKHKQKRNIKKIYEEAYRKGFFEAKAQQEEAKKAQQEEAEKRALRKRKSKKAPKDHSEFENKTKCRREETSAGRASPGRNGMFASRANAAPSASTPVASAARSEEKENETSTNTSTHSTNSSRPPLPFFSTPRTASRPSLAASTAKKVDDLENRNAEERDEPSL